MNFVETLRISWRSIKSHKLRSVLTTLGVVIGVATVITFVTLGASLQADIIHTIAGDNADILYVTAETGTNTGLPNVEGGEPTFTTSDVQHIRNISGVRDVAPQGGIASSAVIHNNSTVRHRWITVTTPNYFDMKEHRLVEGRAYNPGQREVVLNRKAAAMFEENVSVGDQITFVRAVNNKPVNASVVGIVTVPSNGDGGAQSFLGKESKPAIYAPPNPVYQNMKMSPTQDTRQRIYTQLIVRAESPQHVESVQGRIYAYLGGQSDARILKLQDSHFEVTTYDQLVTQIKEVSSTFTVYITGVALISLVVGAIGIANIMLVSVTERTREIGIMKAIGAKKRDILQLFLLEAVLLGLIGTIVGTIVGILGGYFGTQLIQLPLQFRSEWFVIAIFVGILVGIIAGLYPAWEAARTDPIDALRYK